MGIAQYFFGALSECRYEPLLVFMRYSQHTHTQDTRAGLSRTLGWPEVLISFSITLSHSVPRHYTSCRGSVLRARECVSPAEAVPNHSLVTGRLASDRIWTRAFCLGGDRVTTTPPLHHPAVLYNDILKLCSRTKIRENIGKTSKCSRNEIHKNNKLK